MTHEAMKTSTAEEVWAGKITAHETTTGIRIGHVPSRQMRRCSRDERHVQNLSDGTMRILSIFDWRPASWLAGQEQYRGDLQRLGGLELERPEGYPAGGAVGRGADEIDGDGECDRKEIDGAG